MNVLEDHPYALKTNVLVERGARKVAAKLDEIGHSSKFYAGLSNIA
ncbi:MAG: hypothetical protein P4M08_02600 [Oligoflexia bacterium]|nr:hypothetical protein [Oligoflexia bacterium]